MGFFLLLLLLSLVLGASLGRATAPLALPLLLVALVRLLMYRSAPTLLLAVNRRVKAPAAARVGESSSEDGDADAADEAGELPLMLPVSYDNSKLCASSLEPAASFLPGIGAGVASCRASNRIAIRFVGARDRPRSARRSGPTSGRRAALLASAQNQKCRSMSWSWSWSVGWNYNMSVSVNWSVSWPH